MNFIQQKSSFTTGANHHKQITIKTQKDDKSLFHFAKDALITYDHNFIRLVTDEKNKRIVKDISACVASLNKGYFLAKFQLNETFEFRNNLKPSTDLVRTELFGVT